jgi:hypothetical protein
MGGITISEVCSSGSPARERSGSELQRPHWTASRSPENIGE